MQENFTVSNGFTISEISEHQVETNYPSYIRVPIFITSISENFLEPHDNLSFYQSVNSVPVPFRFPRTTSRAPYRVLLADRRMLTGTSQPNARGTLLPPSPPEPQRGHTRTRKSLASQLASTAELPLKITAELHPTPHKKIRQTTIRQRNVTLTDHPPYPSFPFLI
jgi:hypothetical protein